MLHFTYSLQMYISHKWRIPLHQSFVNSFIVIIWMPYAIDLYSTLLYSYRSFQMKRHKSILSSSDQLRWAKLVGTIRCGLPWVCRFAHALAFPMLLHSKSALTALCVCVCFCETGTISANGWSQGPLVAHGGGGTAAWGIWGNPAAASV